MPLTTPPPVPGWHLIAILPLAVFPHPYNTPQSFQMHFYKYIAPNFGRDAVLQISKKNFSFTKVIFIPVLNCAEFSSLWRFK